MTARAFPASSQIWIVWKLVVASQVPSGAIATVSTGLSWLRMVHSAAAAVNVRSRLHGRPKSSARRPPHLGRHAKPKRGSCHIGRVSVTESPDMRAGGPRCHFQESSARMTEAGFRSRMPCGHANSPYRQTPHTLRPQQPLSTTDLRTGMAASSAVPDSQDENQNLIHNGRSLRRHVLFLLAGPGKNGVRPDQFLDHFLAQPASCTATRRQSTAC
jgi:hypothetical protein